MDLTKVDSDTLVKEQKLKKPNNITLSKLKPPQSLDDVLILADISGSMHGLKMNELKRALTSIWAPGITCIGFEAGLWEILETDVQHMHDLGSTHMYEALQEAWKRSVNRIVLMTDGQPTDASEMEILSEVGNHKTPPIDTVGIGDKGTRDYNADFLKEISELTGGKFYDVGQAIKLTTTLKTLLLEHKVSALNRPKVDNKEAITL